MSTVRWAMESDFAVISLINADVDDVPPIESTEIDLRDYPGARILFACTAAAASAGPFAHGATFAIEDAEDDGTGSPDTWAAATTSGSLAKLSAAGQRIVSMLTKRDRPFVRVTCTGDHADVLAHVAALALIFHNP